MINDLPLLSVIIPTFNCEKYVGEMIESIINQTYKNWKLIVVDDGSTDNTYKILVKFAEIDNRITVLNRDRAPKGGQTCRNLGFENSKGSKYVIFFDADDVVAPYCLSQRVKYMEDNPRLDFSIFPARTFSEKIENNKGTYYGYKIFQENDLVTFFTSATPFVVWNNIYKRDSLELKGINWDEKVLSLQDSDFNIQNILKGMVYEYAKDSRIDYYYRVMQTGTVCKQINTQRHQESHLYLLNKILDSLDINQKHEYYIAINSYILRFTRRFASFKCDDLFRELLDNSYFINNKWFKVRLRLFYRLKCICPNWKYEQIVFPKVSSVVRRKRNIRRNYYTNIKAD